MAVDRIAIIVKYFPTVSETFIVNQLNGLIESGLDVQLFAYNKTNSRVIHDSFRKHDLLNKVQYFVAPPKSKFKRLLTAFKWTVKNFSGIKWSLLFRTLNFFKYGKDAYTLKLFYESQWFLLDNEFDMVHSHFGMVGNRIAFLKAKGILPETVKLITTFHGFDLEPGRHDHYVSKYKWLIQECDAFTANTPYLKSLIDEINTQGKAVHVLPVGLDTEFFKRNSPKNDDLFFDLLFCGKLIPLKGADLAIKAVETMHKSGCKNVRLHIVGEGKMMKELRSMADSLPDPDSVIFHGAIDQEKLKEIYEQTDVFILPGRQDPESGRAETQGLVVQEAQAMELPVIVTDVGGMKYGLLPDETGFVISEGDLESMIKKIELLIKDPGLCLNMGKKGRAFVNRNYDNQILTEKLIHIYYNLK